MRQTCFSDYFLRAKPEEIQKRLLEKLADPVSNRFAVFADIILDCKCVHVMRR